MGDITEQHKSTRTHKSTEQRKKNPYSTSTIVRKLREQKKKKQPLLIAFLDIDSTMTGTTSQTNKTRSKLEELGFGIVYVSARPEETLLSSKAFAMTQKLGFTRPQPRMGMKHGKRIYKDPETVVPVGLLDADIIAGSTGTQILIKQESGGYLLDRYYRRQFHQSSESWREKTLTLLYALFPSKKDFMPSSLEDKENYVSGLSDVIPPDYRIALLFDTQRLKQSFARKIEKLKKDMVIPGNTFKQLLNIRVIDDSNPEESEHVLLLTPLNGHKAAAVDSVVSSICHMLKTDRSDLHLLIAGDSFPDVEMGLVGGKGTDATFLVPGGSRLNTALSSKEIEAFACNELIEMRENITQGKEHGHFRVKSQRIKDRHIIIGDTAYLGKKEVDSILSFLEKEFSL